MARGIRERDRTAERRTVDDRLRNPEDVAESTHVVAPLRQGPGLLRTGFTAAISTMIQEDDLRDIGQSREPRLVDRMVKAGATVEEDQRRLVPHAATVRHEAGALD